MAAVKRQRVDSDLDPEDSSDILDWLGPVGARENGGNDWLGELSPGIQLEGDEGGASEVAHGERPSAAAPAAAHFVDAVDVFLTNQNGGKSEPAPQPGPSGTMAPFSAAQPTRAAPCAMGRGPAPVSPQELEIWSSSLPHSYKFTMSVAERELHVRMMKQLLAEGTNPPVITSWVPTKDKAGQPLIRLHTIFRDQCARAATARPTPRARVTCSPHHLL